MSEDGTRAESSSAESLSPVLSSLPQSYLKPSFTRSELFGIEETASMNRTFYENVLARQNDLTDQFFSELYEIMNGPIPRNFVLNIRGGIGRQTGVFKTSSGIQISQLLDPTFTIRERVAFTTREAGEIVKEYATRKQIFLVDEHVRDLKQSSELALANTIESCRERQLCFILIGVPERYYTFSDYFLERLGESHDKYLPRKTVYFSVKKIVEGRDMYRGFIHWNVTPLTDEKWRATWEEYMVRKARHQENAINQQLTGFNITEYARRVINNELFAGVEVNENGIARGGRGYLKNIIFKMYPDMTNAERDMIYHEVLNSEL